MVNRKKIAITGAAGQIGYSLLFRIASGQMFGPKMELELNLIDLERALPALNGTAMELDDCAFSLLKKITCTSDLKEGFKDVDWALLIGSAPRKDGMERSDLLKLNGSIFVEQGSVINDCAADDVKVLVVGNPCNTNCLVAMKNAPRVNSRNFYAMTALDESRARYQLALKSNSEIEDIKNITIWGNHSATQYPDFYNAKINGLNAADKINDINWLQNDFIKIVQQRGAKIIKARGASSSASAANAVISSVVNICNETESGDSYSLALASNGEYSVEKGLIFSYPCYTKNGQVNVMKNVEHNSFAQEKLHKTYQELLEEKQQVSSLGLI